MSKHAFILKNDNEIALLTEEDGVLKYLEVALSQRGLQESLNDSDSSGSIESQDSDDFEEAKLFKVNLENHKF